MSPHATKFLTKAIAGTALVSKGIRRGKKLVCIKGAKSTSRVQVDKGFWDQNHFVRGNRSHELLGENLPSGFKTIDRWDASTGEATSIKSINLFADSYLSKSELINNLKGYADKLDDFKGYSRGGVEIRKADVKQKSLLLAISPNPTPGQSEVIESVVEYASDRGIDIHIVELFE